MPITLNHSNISVQYSTGSNYIIETVKSDLYIRDSRTGISSNLTAEPIVTVPTFTESIITFVHSGGSENQTIHTFTVGQNTICDILMIGGGGGGGKDRAGGGGAGALILSIGNILSGTYNIRVGNGSLGATTGVNAVNGYDSEIYNSNGTIIFRAKGGGGGQSLNDPQAGSGAPDGGCGGGKVSQFTGLGGNAVTTNIVNQIVTGPIVTTTYGVYGNDGGRNTTGWNGSNGEAMDGAGGGGIGQGGTDAGALGPVDSQFVTNAPGKGGDGLYFATINGNTYNFKNYFNVNGVQDGTSGNFFIGGGGGGGGGNSGIGGNGGGGAGGTQNIVGVSATGYGSGGGGAGAGNANGGNGSAGIVVIKFKSIVNVGILHNTTYKTLTYTFNRDNLVAYYKFNNINSLGIDSNPSSTKYNLTPTIVGGTGGYNTSIAVEGASFQATNDGDYLDGDFPLKTVYDSSTSGISVSCWFYRKSGTTYDNMYSTTLYRFFNSSDANLVMNVNIGHINNSINISFDYISGSQLYCNEILSGTINVDTWFHLVYIITKAGNIKVYVNGTNRNLVPGTTGSTIRTSGSATYPITTFPNLNKLSIFNTASLSSKFSGNVDEFYVFNKELSQAEITSLYNKTYTIPSNTYTLNFPVPTLSDINNNSNIVLRGTYDISLSTSNSSIIPKANQYIPYPTTFSTSNISLRYSLLNPILDPIGAQWTYSSNNTNVYHMGSVGIGTTSPEYQLDVRGNIYSSSGGYTQSGLTTWSIASDRRIKENIVKASYEKCLENVKNIELYNFNFKNNYVNTNDRRQLGFIAQEVQQVYPKAVEVGKMIVKNNDGIENILSLNTTQIEYTLYGAVKKLIDNIEDMENEIEEIENTSNITTQI